MTDRGLLHFETIGRGRPIILLHGWINSWAVWRESMIALAAGRRLRVYALDFWGFGDSAGGNSQAFDLGTYVEMVRQFMDNLGIARAPIAGHSMGGTVALQFALRHPDRVERVAMVGSPVVGTTLNPFLQLAGYGWIANTVWRYPVILRLIMHILLAGDSETVQQMISRDVQRTCVTSFFRSIGDLRDTDLRPALPALSLPTLGLFGANDNIVSPRNADLLQQVVPHAEVRHFLQSRHFPMVDEPERFLHALRRFFEQEPTTDARPNGAIPCAASS